MIGVGIPHQVAIERQNWYSTVLNTLSPPYWHNWLFDHIAHARYTPTLFDAHSGRLLQAAEAASAIPCQEWHYLNEPERSGQADVTPEQAASTLRTWWDVTQPHRIKTWAAGVNVTVHVTEAAYAWLDAFIAYLTPNELERIEGWHIHIYGGKSDFLRGLDTFFDWMQRRGVRKPVRITEAGVKDDCGDLMQGMTEVLSAGVVERIYWFSANYPDWNDNDLMRVNGDLSNCGRRYLEVREAGVEQMHIIHLPIIVN